MIERSKRQFIARIQFTETCWIWTGKIQVDGYGRWGKNGQPAHRAAYEFFIGAIPNGLQLDHLCRVRPCVNPTHLEPVTALENSRRSRPYRKLATHCKHGHPFDEANTRYGFNYARRWIRFCRTCERARWRNIRLHHKQAAATTG
jgi:hypothetical protein